MSNDSAAKLHDALHAFESRFRKRAAYPVHKKLRFDESSITDIYDWIIAEIDIPDRGAILDAGCGVGFGTLRIAEGCTANVTGISVSAREIETAKRSANQSVAKDRLSFRELSFDDLPGDAFDLIIAVESLKHSNNLGATLQAMHAAVRTGGQIVIVEDLLVGPEDDVNVARVVECWGLNRLYRENDYREQLPTAECRVVDLTGFIRGTGTIGRVTRRMWSKILEWSGKAFNSPVAAAFLGGARLQRLYDAGNMQYKALIVTIPADVVDP